MWSTGGSSAISWPAGYGLQKAFPAAADWKEQRDLIRMVAEPYLLQINKGIVG